MIIDNVGINEEFWKGKTFSEFQKAYKDKLKTESIKIAFAKLPKDAIKHKVSLKEDNKGSKTKDTKEVKEVKEDKVEK